MEKTWSLVTLNGKTVGVFEIKGPEEVVITLRGGGSVEQLLQKAQRTGGTVALKFFTESEEH